MSILGPLQVIKQSNKIPSAAVIFLHGSGDTGRGVLDWIKFLVGDFTSPHIKFLFPTAPSVPYTPLNRELSTVWFDRLSISPDVSEDSASLEKIKLEIKSLINTQISEGVPINRIVIGGFSMGGALALHMAYNSLTELAGAFALSSFLNRDSAVYKNGTLSNVPLYMCHGDKDTLVPIEWGLETFEQLKQRGVKGEFVRLKNTFHELKKREIEQLMDWVKNVLPPLQS